MTAAPHRVLALLPLLPPRFTPAAPSSLHQTIQRLARCRTLDGIVLITREPRNVPDLPPGEVDVTIHVTAHPLPDLHHAHRLAARKFSPTSWRGGLSGMTWYDEFLAAAAMHEALEAHHGSAALLASPDAPLIDPAICDAVIRRHLDHPDHLKLVFTQAPPGLAGCVVERSLLGELATTGATIASLLEYHPRLPQPDPIGKDPCVAVPPTVRNHRGRFTTDTPRHRCIVESIITHNPLTLTAEEIISLSPSAPTPNPQPSTPQQITLELTTDRATQGPLHAPAPPAPRRAMQLDEARQIFRQLAVEPDVAVKFAGVGDPLLHPDFFAILAAAKQAGIDGLAIETDLLVDEPTLVQLLNSPLDVVVVNLHADTPGTYRQLMGRDDFGRVLGNIEWMLNHRRQTGWAGWIVPRMTKTAANLAELESFFDRWVHYCGHAILDAPPIGHDDRGGWAILDMAPPRRVPCHRLGKRLSIRSDATVALCDLDTVGRVTVGSALDLEPATRKLADLRRRHEHADYPEPCRSCREWHRP